MSRIDGKATGFAERLRALRDSAGLSQAELSRFAGVGLGTVRKLERGEQGPSWAAVIALAEALGKTPDDFLSRE